MTRNVLKYSVAVLSLLAAALLVSGCGSDKKEGNLSVGGVAKVDEASCAQCHGGAREKLTGRVIYDDYRASVHALNSVGCQDCHGGGAQHNGIGPIPFPKPGAEQCRTCHDSKLLVTKYLASKHLSGPLENEEGEPCQRCHTHQGAVLAAQFGFTGDGTVMAAMINAPGLIPNPEAIKCTTCHVTHKPQELRVDAAWNPSVTAGSASTVVGSGSDQYRLCTQCHTYINPAGLVAGSGTLASGTVKVGHHETSWYRVIATTHYDNLATPEIEGYNIRSGAASACFDCHNHEAKTNTNNDPTLTSFKPENTTIYTDWAQSGHALDLLGAKFAAVKANPVNSALPRTDPVRVAQGLAQVDAVMAAKVTAGAFGGHNSGSCARCHTTEGFAYYMDNKSNTPVAVPSGVLKCNGCHTNAGTGALRILAGTKANTNYTTDLGWDPSAAVANGTAYTLNYGKKAYPDVAASNLCISCHDSREKDPGAITAASTTYNRTHYMQAAATMYVKMGFLNLSTGTSGTTTAYLNSLKSDQDGGTITSTHRKLGTPAIIGDSHTDKSGVATFVGYPATGPLASNGPCVACHLVGSHTLKIDQKAITAVCNKCHSSEGGNDITTIASFNQHFIEPQGEVYQNALQLAIDTFNSKNTGITLAPEGAGSTYVRAYATNTLVAGAVLEGTSKEPSAAEWTTAAVGIYSDKTKLLGAVSNVVFLKREPAAYAHARTYSRRLSYDTIDYLDDGVLNMSVAATAVANNAVRFGKGAKAFTTSATVGDIAPGTTESMLFLLAYNRTTGAWTAVARP
jgi:hypothetical protein